MLRVEGLSAGFGQRAVFENLSFSIESGTRLCIIGPSGCGKTTLLLCMAGLKRPTDGKILFAGQPLTAPRREIAVILQEYGLFPWQTVYQNVALPLRLAGEPNQKERVQAMLQGLGLAPFAARYPARLSGGQRQRVAIGRALMQSPRLLLMDEPFAALDLAVREKLEQLLLAECQTNGLSLAMITHDLDEAVFLGQKILCYKAAQGKFTLLDNPAAEQPRESDDFQQMRARLHRLLMGEGAE